MNPTKKITLKKPEELLEILGSDGEVVARIKIKRTPYVDYEMEVFPVLYPHQLALDVRGHGYKLTRKS